MNALGQVCLLLAFVGSGYAGFACIVGRRPEHRAVGRSGDLVGGLSVLALTAVTAVLAWALWVKDFRFAYVAEYSSRLLPWHYSLSALWVGQGGSLLLWAWFSGVLALAYRWWPRREVGRLHESVFGVLMVYLCLLVATMVFAANPMQASLGAPRDGVGLSPLLQHPALLVHPPVVFLGYAGWAIPFALALTALASGRLHPAWVREARPWALFSWAVLGGGILLGAVWAYEELGWGGYWSWDPVENGSLIPWLAGTALIHTLMAWQYRGALKKTTVSLAIATFGLCNFATFLTRSGIFSSLHAFSHSPVGWIFLVVMGGLVIGGGSLVVCRWGRLRPDRPIPTVWAREAVVAMATIALLLLAAATLAGTLAVSASKAILGRAVGVGPPFYNHVLIPTGLLLLVTTAAAPLLRWGSPPTTTQKRSLVLAGGAGGLGVGLAFHLGVRHPIGLAVTWAAVLAVLAVVGAWVLDLRGRQRNRRWLGPLAAPSHPDQAGQPRGVSRRRPGTQAQPGGWPRGLFQRLRNPSRQRAGFLIHLGLICLAAGITGSSLGSRRHELVMHEGQTVAWAGRLIQFVRLTQRELPNKLVAEAELRISRNCNVAKILRPAQHLHRLDKQWTTEVAIDSTWRGDLYTILRGGQQDGSVRLTLVENPLMRWMWCGGWVMAAGAVLGLRPARQRSG